MRAAGRRPSALGHPLASQIIPDLLAEAARNPQIAQTLQGCCGSTSDRSAPTWSSRAIGRGELPAGTDPDLAVDLIVGPLYWRLTIARTPLSKTYLTRLAAAAAAALAAGAPVAAAPS